MVKLTEQFTAGIVILAMIQVLVWGVIILRGIIRK